MRSFPMMLIAVAVYNLIVFGGSLFGHPSPHVVAALQDCGIKTSVDNLLASGFSMKMFSSDIWTFRLGDFVVLFSLVMLFVEIIKATRATSVEVLNHTLSTLVFAGALIEFIVLGGFATSTFFFVVVMCLFDVIAAFTISTVAAKREIAVAAMPPAS